MDYRDIERFALEMNRDHSVVFEATVRTGHGTTDWLQIGKGKTREKGPREEEGQTLTGGLLGLRGRRGLVPAFHFLLVAPFRLWDFFTLFSNFSFSIISSVQSLSRVRLFVTP